MDPAQPISCTHFGNSCYMCYKIDSVLFLNSKVYVAQLQFLFVVVGVLKFFVLYREKPTILSIVNKSDIFASRFVVRYFR